MKIRPRVELKKGAKVRVGDAQGAEEIWWNWSVEVLRGLEELSSMMSGKLKMAQELMMHEVQKRQQDPRHPQRRVAEFLLGDCQRVVDNVKRHQANELAEGNEQYGNQTIAELPVIPRSVSRARGRSSARSVAPVGNSPEQDLEGFLGPGPGPEDDVFVNPMSTPTPNPRAEQAFTYSRQSSVAPVPAQHDMADRSPTTAMNTFLNTPINRAQTLKTQNMAHLTNHAQVDVIAMRARAARLIAQAVRLEAEATNLETDAAIMRQNMDNQNMASQNMTSQNTASQNMTDQNMADQNMNNT